MRGAGWRGAGWRGEIGVHTLEHGHQLQSYYLQGCLQHQTSSPGVHTLLPLAHPHPHTHNNNTPPPSTSPPPLPTPSHTQFLSGTATTSFIERNPSLFTLSSGSALQSSKLLTYLAEMVVNGPHHPGATGPPPVRVTPAPPPHAVGPPPAGWREVLEKEGPEGWARAVREHQGVLLTDTTWCVGGWHVCGKLLGVHGCMVTAAIVFLCMYTHTHTSPSTPPTPHPIFYTLPSPNPFQPPKHPQA